MKQINGKASRDSGQALPMPKQRTRLVVEKFFTQNEFDQVLMGLIPQSMDDKWLIFLEDMQLNFHRSWTGHCVYQIQFEKRNDGYVIVEAWANRDQKQYKNNNDDYDIALLLFLIDNLLLKKNTPFPLPSQLSNDLPKGVYQHTVAGTSYPEVSIKKK
jgi:hypothetical protein